MKIKIKYFDASIPKLKKIQKGDWIDLYTRTDIKMKKGDMAMLKLNVAMELPNRTEAYVVPRSSTPKNFGIIQANSIGIIDNTYNGDDDEWGFMAIAIRDTEIRKGDRIAQFRIFENQEHIEFQEAEILKNENRNGFGSTGRR